MRLPRIPSQRRYKREVVLFKGLNLTRNFSEGDFSDGTGFSHLYFPSLTQRQKLALHKTCKKPSAAGFSSAECVAESGALYYDGKEVGKLTEGEKQLVFMGVYVVVFPDKAYYNTLTEEFGKLDFRANTKGVKVTFNENSISVAEGNVEIFTKKETLLFKENEKLNVYESININEGKLEFLNYSEVLASEIKANNLFCNNCLPNQYRKVTSIEKNEDGDFKISCELISVVKEKTRLFENFRPGDAVTVSGCEKEANNKTAVIASVKGNVLTFSDAGFQPYNGTEEIAIERKVPDFTCACSFQNRLWGCEKNTIHASKLGDPFNFFSYRQLSTDSFTVSANTAGDFTACIPYGNSCLFFKENSCYKLFGNKPSNFQLTESFAGGIKKDCRDSLSLSGGRLFYKGVSGVYVYYGGLPELISEPLENMVLENASGGADDKYYYLAADTENGREMLIFDAEHGLWSRWGKTDIKKFSGYNGKVFALKNDGMYEITNEPDNDFWSVTLKPTNEKFYGKKNYSKIFIRAELFENAWIKLEISTDGSEFYTAKTHHSTKKCHINIPVSVRGCNELTLRISGRGKSILESIVREFSVS